MKETERIEKGKINILDVSEIKGLEFKKVYVISKNMTKNERYLSYSRALNHLVIID